MFVGHFAPALLGATLRGAPPLAILFVAAQFVDWVFFALVLMGVERLRIRPGYTAVSPFDLYHMPYTHSLLGCAVLSLIFGAYVYFVKRALRPAVIACCVAQSHWILDWLVHVPDLTLAGRPPKHGLGMWRSASIEMPLELGLTLGSLWYCARRLNLPSTCACTLAGVLLALQLSDWYGPKPDEPGAVLCLMAWAGYAIATATASWASHPDSKRR